jgi:hypothetical protein
VECLAPGEQRSETFDVTVKDGHGGNVTRTVSIVITGTNDGVTVMTSPPGTPAPGTQVLDRVPAAFADVDAPDTQPMSLSDFNVGDGNVGAAPGIVATSIADAINGTGDSLSWTSPSILAQWSILRPIKN